MDHTKRFPRTLAGFGLTGHGGSRFSCFWEILETHFITKYIKIGPRASRLVFASPLKPGGFWLNGLRRKSILENDHQNTNFRETGNTAFFEKMATCFMPFYCFYDVCC